MPLGELVDIMDVGFACAYLTTSTHNAQAYLDINRPVREPKVQAAIT